MFYPSICTKWTLMKSSGVGAFEVCDSFCHRFVFHVPFQHWFGVCAASNQSWYSCLCAHLCIAEKFLLIFYLSCYPSFFFHLPVSALVTHHSLLGPSQMCPLRTGFTAFLSFPFRWNPQITKWQFLCFLPMSTLQTHQDCCYLWVVFL